MGRRQTDAEIREAVEAVAKHGSKRSAAKALGIDESTVRSRLKSAKARGLLPSSKGAKTKTPPKDHACKRADWLRASLTEMVGKSRWPVVNPEAIVVESRVTQTYSKASEGYVDKELAPRTYVNGPLHAEDIVDCKGRRFLFTRAQNQTPVHRGLWNNMQAYAEAMGADIVVGPDTYETAWWHESNTYNRSYAPEIEDYLCFGRMEIGDDFVFLGDMNVLTTATKPISDLTAQTTGKWTVVPHSKMQLESVATLDPSKPARQIMTTGSVTIPKVIPRKAGVKSLFDHIMGFVVVEFDEDGYVHCRHVNALDDDGSFMDLTYNVRGGLVFDTKDNVEAIVFGDAHVAKLDRANPADVYASFGFSPVNGRYVAKSLMHHLTPKQVYFHDLHDAEPDNQYTWGDLGMAVELATRGRQTIEREIRGDGEFLATFQSRHPKVQAFVVESNHDIKLDRYIKEARYRDGFNALFGLHLDYAQLSWRKRVAEALDAGDMPPKFSLLEYAIREFQPGLKRVRWLYDGDSHVVHGVELGHHGFRGANGAKSSTPGYARLGRKIMTGDPHSPGMLGGTIRVGTMSLKHGYNKGPSGWAVCHGILYSNGKRALVTLQNGRYRLEGFGRPIHGVVERAKAA